MKVAIVGAGIAGLAAAVACRQAGFEVKVFEQSNRLRSIGGGLLLYPHAVRILRRIGLASWLDQADVGLRKYYLYGADNSLLIEDELGEFVNSAGGPVMPVLRNDLLLALARPLDKETLAFGQACVGIENGARATVEFSDGSHHEADVVIVASGVHSQVARRLAETNVHYTGLCFWGGVLKGDERIDIPRQALKWWYGIGLAACLFPMTEERQWWYIMGRIAETALDRGPDKLRQPRALCRGWNAEIDKLLQAPPTENNFAEPIHELSEPARWTAGRVAVIGDALHAIGPTSGQGANAAIEDAYALARCLARYGGELERAFRRYEEIRSAPMLAIRTLEANSARMRVTFDLELIAQRDRSLRGVSVRQLLAPLLPLIDESSFNSVPEYQ